LLECQGGISIIATNDAKKINEGVEDKRAQIRLQKETDGGKGTRMEGGGHRQVRNHDPDQTVFLNRNQKMGVKNKKKVLAKGKS